MSQIYKKFNTDMVVGMLKKYLKKEIDREYIQELLGIKKSRFFSVLKRYKENLEIFSIEYKKNQPKRINNEFNKTVSFPTIIDRAKKNGLDFG